MPIKKDIDLWQAADLAAYLKRVLNPEELEFFRAGLKDQNFCDALRLVVRREMEIGILDGMVNGTILAPGPKTLFTALNEQVNGE